MPPYLLQDFGSPLDLRFDIAEDVARHRGYRSTPIRLASLTNTVFRFPAEGIVLRVAPDGVDIERVQREVSAVRELRRRGVTYVPPVDRNAVGESRGITYSLWKWIEPEGEVDWEAAGRLVAALHRTSLDWIRYRLEFPNLHPVRRAIRRSLAAGLIEPSDAGNLLDQARRLASWNGRIQWTPEWRGWTTLHGDLWPANFIPGAQGVVLCDTDHLRHGPIAWDLAFVRLALHAGLISPDSADAFSAGYGAPLTSTTNARWVRRWHDLEWTAWAVEHRHISPECEELARMALGWWRP